MPSEPKEYIPPFEPIPAIIGAVLGGVVIPVLVWALVTYA